VRINEKVLNRPIHLCQRVGLYVRLVQSLLDLWYAPPGISDDHANTIPTQYDTRDSFVVLDLITHSPRIGRSHGENIFSQFLLQIVRRIAEQQLALVQERNPMAALCFIQVGSGRKDSHSL